MAILNSGGDAAAPAIWEYTSPDRYALPSDTVEQKIRSGIGALWKAFETEDAAPESPVKAKEKLEELSWTEISTIAPDPGLDAAAEALDAALASRLPPKLPENTVVFVISPPYTWRREIMAEWAQRSQWRLLDGPDPQTLLSESGEWMRDRFDGRSPWVLPHLENCYLRRARSLKNIRHLLDMLCAGVAGTGLVGCDSWAWAYLMKIWNGRQPGLLSLQSFDQERLARWFGELAAGDGPRRRNFRQAIDGKYVLTPVDDVDEESGETPKASSFLKHLAACSRGIPGVALALWRRALRLGPENTDDEGNDDNGPSPPGDPATVWITEWDAVPRPKLPSEKDRDLAFTAHTLLLHGGLEAEVLAEILPLSVSRVRQTLSVLRETETAVEEDGIWRITASGYPAVRQFLQSEGYLTDHF